jgi:pyruvate,water dikinase
VKVLLPIERTAGEDRALVGGKALALARLGMAGFNIPQALCVTTEAYRRFVDSGGLRGAIARELGRKRFEDMRWEEIWDAALRIRTLFDRTAWPIELGAALREGIRSEFGDRPVAVRSSAPGEDGVKASFAGLHESFLNVQGPDAVLDNVRRVFGSLWSDRALLYRKELGLTPTGSEMAVLVQELVPAERSGVVFGVSPFDPAAAVVESVWGLNEGLVDGTVEPDRWTLCRSTGKVVDHHAPVRKKRVVPGPAGTALSDLPPDASGRPPISDDEACAVFRLALAAEEFFGSPQDLEWCIAEGVLHVLQSRPVTTRATPDGSDNRSWYLSLKRSFTNLKNLRDRVEGELLPAMGREAEALASADLPALADGELEEEIRRREGAVRRWEGIYKSEFIPLAHGIRLFGQFYNDAVAPEDPFEFTLLLSGTGMLSLERNALLGKLAERLRTDRNLAERVGRDGRGDTDFESRVGHLFLEYGDFFGSAGSEAGRRGVLSLLLEMSRRPPGTSRGSAEDGASRRDRFLSRFDGEAKNFAGNLLELARGCYRLRDDDNICLGRLHSALARAVEEQRRRPSGGSRDGVVRTGPGRAIETLNEPSDPAGGDIPPVMETSSFLQRDRQLVGHPAGPGYARGPARVVRKTADLFALRTGEVLVCDAVDPNMTFAMPLASAVVERRGGMLIHGAIIAREYGIPCVTGVPDAVHRIRTGDTVSVDGYLGIVTRSGHEASCDIPGAARR